MAKDDKVQMPFSSSGITQYFEDYETSLKLTPVQVMVVIGIIAGLVVVLNIYGNSLLGI